MKMVEMWLAKQVLARREKYWNIHQKFQDVREPWLQRPVGGDKRDLQILRLADLGEDIGNEDERREGIRLEAVPILAHNAGGQGLGIHHRGEIHWEPVVHGRGEEVDVDWPTAEEIPANLLAQSPFRAQHLGTTAEGVRQDVELPRHKLGEQMNIVGLAEAQDGLSHGIECRRPGTPLLAQVGQSQGVVHEARHRLAAEKMKETADHIQNGQEFSMVDGKCRDFLSPEA